ncbi:YqhG family protein [Cohnella caldifontis]|uniref:YqhG family protein n=1 Tax=Cohnella caldifontis TaxID=3027471 RepID=UPI0023ECA472|nr:YqhG family protein [Cohnella sp. YIM B05605]
MNVRQVQKFVLAYLEATGSQLIEKSPNHITVKLSPEADRALTGRPFYWSFIDNTGTVPETMTYSWMFGKSPPPQAGVPATPLTSLLTPSGRVSREEIYFGSRRLNQFFDAVRQTGRCVTLFEEPPRGVRDPLRSAPYTAWLGVNFKVGYECDMKREELYGWGISLATGIIDEKFFERLDQAKLSPRLPPNIHLLKNGISLRKAMSQLEHALERKLKTSDFAWAEEAEERRREERKRIKGYYGPQLERASDDPDQSAALQARMRQRLEEIDWQYRPRVGVSVVNCGIFHLPGLQ